MLGVAPSFVSRCSLLLTQILLPLTIASLGLLALLTCGLVLERVARNRREQRAWSRRRSYAEVLAHGHGSEVQRLALSAARSVTARGDLVDALALTGWTTGPVFAEFEPLYAAAADDIEHRDVARRAIGASLLGVIGGAAAIALLQDLMRGDDDYELRLIAARALRIVGGDEAAWELIRGPARRRAAAGQAARAGRPAVRGARAAAGDADR